MDHLKKYQPQYYGCCSLKTVIQSKWSEKHLSSHDHRVMNETDALKNSSHFSNIIRFSVSALKRMSHDAIYKGIIGTWPLVWK